MDGADASVKAALKRCSDLFKPLQLPLKSLKTALLTIQISVISEPCRHTCDLQVRVWLGLTLLSFLLFLNSIILGHRESHQLKRNRTGVSDSSSLSIDLNSVLSSEYGQEARDLHPKVY